MHREARAINRQRSNLDHIETSAQRMSRRHNAFEFVVFKEFMDVDEYGNPSVLQVALAQKLDCPLPPTRLVDGGLPVAPLPAAASRRFKTLSPSRSPRHVHNVVRENQKRRWKPRLNLITQPVRALRSVRSTLPAP